MGFSCKRAGEIIRPYSGLKVKGEIQKRNQAGKELFSIGHVHFLFFQWYSSKSHCKSISSNRVLAFSR